MPSAKKLQTVDQLKEKVARAESITFAQYTGLNVKQMTELRRRIKAAGGEVMIARNRLVNVALGTPAGLADKLQDQLLTLFAYTDPVSALKELTAFVKENELPVIKAGFFENKVLDAAQVEQLSKTPSKPELVGMLLRTLQGPGYGLRNVMEAGPRNLVYALNAIADKKKSE